MQEENETMWKTIPLDAISILQRLCYHCFPSGRIRLMMKILEARGGNWYDKRSGTTAEGKKRPREEGF